MFRESPMASFALPSLVASVSDSSLEIFPIQTLKIKLLWSEEAHGVCQIGGEDRPIAVMPVPPLMQPRLHTYLRYLGTLGTQYLTLSYLRQPSQSKTPICTKSVYLPLLKFWRHPKNIQRILQSWLQHSHNFFFETSSKSSSNNSILMLKSQLNTYFYKSEQTELL